MSKEEKENTLKCFNKTIVGNKPFKKQSLTGQKSIKSMLEQGLLRHNSLKPYKTITGIDIEKNKAKKPIRINKIQRLMV